MAISDRGLTFLLSSLTDEATFEELRDLIDGAARADLIVNYHASVIAPAHSSSSPGKTPSPVAYGAVLGDIYAVGISDGFQTYKLPASYAGNLSVHVHWTKSGNANEATKTVRWRVSYFLSPASGVDVNVAPSTVTIDDTYDDTGTTTRVLHVTPDTPLSGGVASRYLYLKIEAIAPGGTPLAADPVLVSLDIEYDQYINRAS